MSTWVRRDRQASSILTCSSLPSLNLLEKQRQTCPSSCRMSSAGSDDSVSRPLFAWSYLQMCEVWIRYYHRGCSPLAPTLPTQSSSETAQGPRGMVPHLGACQSFHLHSAGSLGSFTSKYVPSPILRSYPSQVTTVSWANPANKARQPVYCSQSRK